MEIELNYLAVLVGALAAFFAGWLWYSPFLFGKVWMKLKGIKQKDMKADNMPLRMLGGVVAALVTAYVLAYFMADAGVADVGGALELAFWLWLGFTAPVMFGAVLWDNKPFAVYAIDAVYRYVAFGIMALVIVSWV